MHKEKMEFVKRLKQLRNNQDKICKQDFIETN